MVANTRDEPFGGAQGIKRAKKEGRNPKTYGGGASSGYVPNFAAGLAISGLTRALGSLTSSTTRAASQMKTFASGDKIKKAGNYLKENALSIGFGLQTVSSMIAQAAPIDKSTRGGKMGSAVIEGVGTIASFAGTGAMFGPWGAAIGAAVGATVAITDGIKTVNSKLPEMQKSFEDSQNTMARFGESGQKLLELNEKYSDALLSGDPSKAGLIAKTQQAYAEELAKLTDGQRKTMVSAIALGNGQEAYAEMLAQMQEKVSAEGTNLALQNYVENGDKKAISGIENDLASGLTQGLSMEQIQAAIDKTYAFDAPISDEGKARALIDSFKSLDGVAPEIKKRIESIGKQFAEASYDSDLGDVSQKLIDLILTKPKAAADLEKITEQLKKTAEENAALAKKEADIRKSTNARLLSLQASSEKVTRNFVYTLEDLVSSMETASKLRSGAREASLNFYKEGGLTGDQVDKAEQRSVVASSKDKLAVDTTSLLVSSFTSFNSSLNDLIAGIEATPADPSGNITDAKNVLDAVKVSLESALLPIGQSILNNDFSGAQSNLESVLAGLTKEEKAALNPESIEKLRIELSKGFEKSSRELQVLESNSKKDLAIQAQQLAFQKAMSKLAVAQAIGGTAEDLFGENRGAKDLGKSINKLKLTGFSSESTKVDEFGKVTVGGEDPGKRQAGALFDFYKKLSQFTGGGVNLQSGSADFKLLVQVAKDQLKANLDTLRQQGEGVVDPAVFDRITQKIATLGGDEKVSQLKILKELGVEGVTGKNILDESLKQFSSGAFANLDPSLKSAFSETQDAGAAVSLLLLADQQKQTGALMGGLQALGALGQATGNQTLSVLAQQPTLIAQALGAVLKASNAESKLADAQIELDKKALPAKKLDEKISEQKVEAGKLSGKKASKEASLEVQLEEIMGKSGAVAQKLKGASLIKEDGGIDYAKLKEVLSSAAPTGPGSSVWGGSNPVGDTANKRITATWEDLRGQLAEIEKIESERAATSENVSNLEKKRKGLEPGLSEAEEKVKTLTTKRDEASKAAEVAQQKAAPVYDTGKMESALQAFEVFNEQQQKTAAAATIVATPSEKQKEAFARSNLAGKTSRDYELDRTGGTPASYENKAVGADRSGANSIKVFNDLLSQNVIPSMQNFGKIYAEKGKAEGSSGAEVYKTLARDMLGPLADRKNQGPSARQPEDASKAKAAQDSNKTQESLLTAQNEGNVNLQSIAKNTADMAAGLQSLQLAADGNQGGKGAETGGGGSTLNVSTPVNVSISLTGGAGEEAGNKVAAEVKVLFESLKPQIESIAKNAVGIVTPPKQLKA